MLLLPGLFAAGQANGQSRADGPLLAPELQQRVRQVKDGYDRGVAQNIRRPGYWDSLLPPARTHRLPLYECRILMKIGDIRANDNSKQAILLYTEALALAEEQGYKTERFALMKSLAGTYALRFDRKMSLRYIYGGLKLAVETKDKKAAIDFYSWLGIHHFLAGDPERALNIHLLNLEASRRIGYEYGIVCALVDVGGDLSLIPGRAGECIPYYLESRKYLPLLGQTPEATQAHEAVATAYHLTGQYDSAFIYAGRALRIARATGNKRAMASALSLRASLYLSKQKNGPAKKDLLRALRLATAVNFTAQLPDVYAKLKTIYSAEGNYRQALRMDDLADRLRDSISNEKARRLALEKEFAHRVEKKENLYRLLDKEHRIKLAEIRQHEYLQLALGLFILVAGLIVWLLWRQHKLKTDNERLWLRQKLLLTQMNPHFLFNSMNAIRQLVADRENEQAERYLHKFSRLIRNILESSLKENTLLKDEIDLLHAYLEMESLRFDGSFDYSIHIDPPVDPGHTNIPHLMIQPFVENAIWHGLLPKKGERLLRITIGPDSEKTIRCTIDDNGVGRNARKPQEGTVKKKSLALLLVQQRLDLMAKTREPRGGISITDKKDMHDSPSGTTVTLILPVMT